MAHLWQHPYVNVFKHFNVQEWKKSTKEGEVVSVMDKSLKCTIYRITGSIPAGNYIQLPKTSSQSLGLTGRYLYLALRPIPSKYFVVHIDVATQDALVVRISFSNLFKEFKSTSTWLQFPFVCHAARGSIHDSTSIGSREHIGPAPMSTKWTLLCLDFQYILSMYLNRKYSYTKSVRLCANLLVKNIFTSDMEYEPGLSVDQVKKSGLSLHGLCPLPRELSFPLKKGDNWHDHYDYIKFPSDANKKPFDSIQFSKSLSAVQQNGPPGTISPKRISPKKVDVSRAVSDRVSLINKFTGPPKQKSKRRPVTQELPRVGLEGDVSIVPGQHKEVHVYADPEEQITIHHTSKHVAKKKTVTVSPPVKVIAEKSSYQTLQPDPILQLKRIVGFGGSTTKEAVWASNGTVIVYPCHAVIVAMQVSNGYQRFFIGHTDKVSCLSLNSYSNLLASGQTGSQSVVRVWRYQTGECVAMFKGHVHSLSNLSLSHSGGVLCGVGKDSHGKNMVVIWNTSLVCKGGKVSVMAKAHTDVDIVRMRIAAFDDTRMVSCGRDNIRLWRVKDGQLRSAPVNLAENHLLEFTDVCFEAGYQAAKDPADRLIYACSRAGHIFEVNYQKLSIHHIRRLLPVDKKHRREKQTFNSGPGIAITSMCMNEAFCVTGSEDGYLRLWPLDFAHVYLEAEHEGPVTAVDITEDGMKILAGTATGNLGTLDVSTRAYTTLMRSHTDSIFCVAMDPMRRHLATASADHTIRVWDSDTLQQIYDFSAPQECPCTLVYHPTQQVFACGFETGSVRVFNVATTSMLAEHKQHRGKVTGICYSPNGDYLYSCGSLGSLALHDAENNYQLMRLLGNTVARGEVHGPDALTVSPDGLKVAFVGPSDFTVSVVDGRSLDELLRIDITSLNPADNTRTVIDSAVKVCYTPAGTRQLLVTTTSNRLLKFDARTGKLLAEIANVHRSGISALHVSEDGRHLVTAGDKVIKVWDYHMRLDLNFQVFIGHSGQISKVYFSPDHLSLISTGEALFIWDFLSRPREIPRPEGRTPVKSYLPAQDNQGQDVDAAGTFRSPVRRSLGNSFSDLPRTSPPKPTEYLPPKRIEDISAILKQGNGNTAGGALYESDSEESGTGEREEVLIGPELQDQNRGESPTDNGITISRYESLGQSPQVQSHKRHQIPTKSPAAEGKKGQKLVAPSRPTVLKHFQQREKKFAMAQRRYTAPPNQAGLRLKAVIGYNGNGRGNMVWHPETGFFAYTSGCIIIIEDLTQGSQKHLTGHVEEISTLALQNDCQVLASASGSCGLSSSQICMWDLQKLSCKKVLVYHEHEIVCLAFSRDDRFLISVGDYRECSVVVWSCYDYSILTTSKTNQPVYELRWDPYTMNEFVTVGQNGSILFWLLDETQANASLNVHEAEVPEDLLQTHHMGSGQVDFTAAVYAGDSTLFVSTSNGQVSAWDTRHNSCFMHWESDTHEIGLLCCHGGRLITGSAGGNVRLWSTVGVGELKLPGEHHSMRRGGLTMEDEMALDGAVVSAAFDETLDMGIVGTVVGTLWYINWTERTSIRLVSGHMSKINSLAMSEDEFFASCADDGSLRVWSVKDREQTLQFQVVDQSCTCMAFSPKRSKVESRTTVSNLETTPVVAHHQTAVFSLAKVVAGYSDGTVRMFDLNKVEMVLKMHPHAVSVSAIQFSADGRMILSGGSDGLVAVSSPTTGMTVRVISDHKGAPITGIDVTFTSEHDLSVSAPLLWLVCSADRRVSVWSADWSKDFCELADWLTFPAPAFTPEGAVIKKGDQGYYEKVPPSMARFSLEEPDIIVYTGYGMQKQVLFYSMQNRQVIRTAALTHWSTSMDLSANSPIIALAANERLLKLMDYYEGSFQDYTGHNDSVQLVRFSPDGRLLLSAAHSEILIWDVLV